MGNSSDKIETLLSSNKDRDDGYSYYAVFDSSWFDQGVSRYAFKGEYRGRGPKSGKPCVVKVFKKQYARNFDEWVPDLAASTKANEYAIKWNTTVMPRIRNQFNGLKSISFKIPLIAKVDDDTMTKCFSRKNQHIMPQEYLSIESYITGDYQKFTSNGGYEGDISDILPCFSHWTFVNSGGQIMVTDLQGVKGGNHYYLTDPAIHSADQIYGMTDGSVAGMLKVLECHQCNSLCVALGLKNPVPAHAKKNPKRAKKSTSYDFELTPAEKRMITRKKTPYFSVIAEE